ncbi:hypothetical protein FSP39_020721 [Pinctada imbricata]|uniref:Reverse transcriptase domain-containing protein n=1 Tax=Pinctada imbricata TaxID=66713 RepID=A0AA88Y476_PINIB|nr:hypothetical protein FSP39_020721 [Pinctada imbricata]
MGNRRLGRPSATQVADDVISGLRAHNFPTIPIIQMSLRTHNCDVKEPPHWLFWIPYLFMEIFIGTPLTFMFLSLGQYCSSGILTCWKFAPLCSGIGGSMFLLCFLTSLYFAVLPAWSLIYLVNTGHLANQECSLSVSSFLPSNVSSPEHYVITPADKASNNYTFTCKKYYFDSQVKELGLNSTPGNPTYTPTNLSASEIIDNHKSALASFGFDTTNLDLDLPYLYCIPKMHKNPYKQRFIAGSSKCSTKSVSILLTKILSEIKSGLQRYCSTVYCRSGINQMWILKNSKELLEHLKSTHFSRVHLIKDFDFSTLNTTNSTFQIERKTRKNISNAFTSKNGNRKYKFIVVNYDKTYFVKEKSESENKYTETDIIQMLNFLIDNIFVVFGGKVFQQIVGIPMGTNCAPLLADIFLYSYEAEFIQSLVSEGKRYLASDFSFTYRYIDDVLSINNPKFADYLSSIYPSDLEVKETTETNNSASYLDIMLSYNTDGHMNTSLYDKRDDFNFSITNFPFLSSNIPSSPAYGVFISQLIRYARASTKYTDFVLRVRRLSDKLLSQGYVCGRLTSPLRKFYGRYGELVIHYDVPLSRMVDDILS